MNFIRGASWTKSRLNRLISKICTEDKERIVEQYWEYIVNPEAPVNKQLEQVVCSVPNGASYSDEFIILQLVQGPAYVNRRDDPCAKPAIAKELYAACGKASVDTLMLEWGAQHKHCPLNTNAEWCFIVCIAECIDLVYTNSGLNSIPLDDIVTALTNHLNRALLLEQGDISLIADFSRR